MRMLLCSYFFGTFVLLISHQSCFEPLEEKWCCWFLSRLGRNQKIADDLCENVLVLVDLFVMIFWVMLNKMRNITVVRS